MRLPCASTYTTSTNFSLEFFSLYHWSGSANVSPEQATTFLSAEDEYEGAPSPGDGDVQCAVYAADGVPHSGDTPVTVVPQFQWTWNTPQVVINTAVSGGENVAVAAGGTTGSTQTQTYSVTAKAAYSMSSSVGVEEVAQAADSLTLSVGVTYTGSSTQTTSVTNYTAQAEGICIGQELSATSGKVVISTPSQGPGSPQTCYKYELDGNGLSIVAAGDPTAQSTTNGFTAYPDPNTPSLYEVSSGG